LGSWVLASGSERILAWWVSISINFGVLEYWSDGVMTKGLMSFFSTLHHSITPKPKLSRTFGNL